MHLNLLKLSNSHVLILLVCLVCFMLHKPASGARTKTTSNISTNTTMANDGEEKTFKVLVTSLEVPAVGMTLMSRACELIVCESVPLNREEMLHKAKGVHGMFWATHDKLDAEVLDAAGPQLKSISTMSAGIDQVDVEELKKRHIPLGHTPGVLSTAVADLAMGLMLSAARRLHEGRVKIETSTWENYHLNWLLGQDIRDATVGFFGLGNIGQAIAKRLSGFEIARIIYTTRTRIPHDKEKEFNAKKVPFDELLAKSDILFIAAPLTNETQGVFNATAFSKMKKTAVLVNIARGPIVNQDDLYNALKTNQIFAAGIDVVNPEPLPADDPLMSLPNLVISPHIGSATERTRNDMATIAAHNVLRGLADEPMFAPAY